MEFFFKKIGRTQYLIYTVLHSEIEAIGESRISQREDANLLPNIIFAENCMKTKKTLDREGM